LAGSLLNVEQSGQPASPDIQGEQLRPVSLYQLCNASCTEQVVPAEGRRAGVEWREIEQYILDRPCRSAALTQ
jgi:hypothetical protein